MKSVLVRMLAALFALAALAAPAHAKRVALVVGVGDYATLSDLANPVHDARAMSALLREHGFQVKESLDPTSQQFADAIAELSTMAEGADEAVVFFAGHGMAAVLDDKLANVVVPSDAKYACGQRRIEGAVAMQTIAEAIAKVPRKVLLFDACRNDPFKDCEGVAKAGFGYQEPAGRDVGAGDGANRTLVRPGPTASSGADDAREGGTLIGFSTDLGAFASDGEAGKNSPFTLALVAELRADPARPLREVLDRTSARVKAATKFFQVPWVVTKGGDPEICLAGKSCSTSRTLSADKLRERSAALVRAAEDYLRAGEPSKAVELAVNALPRKLDGAEEGAAAPEAVDVLRRAMLRVGASASVEIENVVASGAIVNARQRLILAPRSGTRSVALFALDGHLLGEFGSKGAAIEYFDLSPDGTRILTAENDGTSYVWDRQGKQLARMTGHARDTFVGEDYYFREAKFSADGRYVLTSGADFTVRVWDAAGGRQVGLMRHEHYASAVMAPNQQFVVTEDGGKLAVWALDGRKIRAIDTNEETLGPLQVSPDSKFIAAVAGFQGKGNLLFWTPAGERFGFSDKPNIKAFNFVGNGSEVAVHHLPAGTLTHELVVLDLAARKHESVNADAPVRIANSAGGDLLAAVVEGRGLRVWSKTPKQLHEFRVEGGEDVVAVEVLPGSSEVAVLLDLATTKTVDTPPNNLRLVRYPLFGGATAAGARTLPVAAGWTTPAVTLLDAKGGRVFAAPQGGNAVIWNSLTGAQTETDRTGAEVSAGAVLGNDTIVLGLADGGLETRDWSGRALARFKGSGGKAEAIIPCGGADHFFTVDGQGVLSFWLASERRSVKLAVKAESDEQRPKADRACKHLAVPTLHDDGKIEVRLFDRGEAAAWQPTATLAPEGLGRFEVTRDGRFIVTSDLDIEVYSSAGRRLHRLRGHTSEAGQDAGILALALVEDDAKLLSVATDNTVRLWDLGDGRGKVLTNSEQDYARTALSVSPDGKQLALSGDRVFGFDGTAWRPTAIRVPPISVLGLSGDGRFIYGNESGTVVADANVVVVPLDAGDQQVLDRGIEIVGKLKPLTRVERCRYALESGEACGGVTANAN